MLISNQGDKWYHKAVIPIVLHTDSIELYQISMIQKMFYINTTNGDTNGDDIIATNGVICP